MERRTDLLNLQRTLSFIFLAWVLLTTASVAQSVSPDKLLLLVAGPSGDRIDPQEKAVVDHLNGLRVSSNFPQLQMGTMHYDRPHEASLLKNVLGFSPQKGITVGFVQLSDQGVPVRTLYKMENMTQSKLLAAQNDLLSRWSQTTGQPLPPGLRPQVNTPTPPPISTSPPLEPVRPPANGGLTYTEEGVQSVIRDLDDRFSAMWAKLRNAPLRPDGNDLLLREQTKVLSEATAAMRARSQAGVILPLDEVLATVQAGRAWRAAEPQYFLPVEMRQEVKSLNELLNMLDDIGAQGTRLRQNTP